MVPSFTAHIYSLINDILDVSKIESGKVVLTFEEFTLNDLVSSVDAIIRPMAKGKNQASVPPQAVCSVSPVLPPVLF